MRTENRVRVSTDMRKLLEKTQKEFEKKYKIKITLVEASRFIANKAKGEQKPLKVGKFKIDV